MTTSHRPQLEARSGAKSAKYVPTTTQHARLLPGHTKLKYRVTKEKPANEKFITHNINDIEIINDREELNTTNVNTVEDRDDSENDVESSDDEEALLLELNKIRKEKMLEKVRKEQEDEDSLEARVAFSNFDSSGTSQNAKKAWRTNTAFGRNKATKRGDQQKKDDKNPEYINNLTNSKYHQDFLKKYIK